MAFLFGSTNMSLRKIIRIIIKFSVPNPRGKAFSERKILCRITLIKCIYSAINSQNLFHINKLLLMPWKFWSWIFPLDVVPFQNKEVGCFFGPWTTIQMGPVTSSQGFIHMGNKHKQRKIAFFFHRMPDLYIVFECNNKNDSENGTALDRIPFFNDHCPEWVRRRKKMGRSCNLSLFVCLFCGWMKCRDDITK